MKLGILAAAAALAFSATVALAQSQAPANGAPENKPSTDMQKSGEPSTAPKATTGAGSSMGGMHKTMMKHHPRRMVHHKMMHHKMHHKMMKKHDDKGM